MSLSPSASSWSTQQLTELLATVRATDDAATLVRRVVEHAAEALDAEVGAVVSQGSLLHCLGFPRDAVPVAALLEIADGRRSVLHVPGAGACLALAVDAEGTHSIRLLLARSGTTPFTQEERSLLRGTGRVLGMALASRQMLDDLRERQALLERLSRIQGSISSRVPLQEVLDTITAGAAELIGDEITGLRLLDPDDSESLLLVSSVGVPGDLSERARRSPVGSGVGGQACAWDRLVVTETYTTLSAPIRGFAEDGIRSAMAVPVRQGGRPVGSLTVATRQAQRHYSQSEREVLIAFAEHVSLALNDAQTVESLQHAVDEATHQSLHDSLTGLPNRALFLDRLARACQRSTREHTVLSVLFLDLDDFKLVNDSLGHLVGDALLREVGARLASVVRESDTVARLGGDEFALVLERTPADEALATAERLIEAVSLPFTLSGQTVFVGASVGLVAAGGEAVRAEGLLRDADVAMYRAKADGKRRCAVFEPGMRHRLQERTELERDLRAALERGELVVHHQPVVDVVSGLVVSTEALVRWEHPRRGLLGPGEFVPLAEDTGLIVAMGSIVLREACRTTARWQLLPGLQHLTVSVNLSPRQMREPSLVDDVTAALRDAGLSPGSLVLEITESLLVSDLPGAVAQLHALKALGVRIAIDDFGTGYSSLAYLSQLPVDVLKVDRSFVAGLGVEGRPEGKLATVVLALAASLGLEAVAEGVETPSQADLLTHQGCARQQGYLWSKAVPAGELPDVAAALRVRLRAAATPATTDPPTPAPAIPSARAGGLPALGAATRR